MDLEMERLRKEFGMPPSTSVEHIIHTAPESVLDSCLLAMSRAVKATVVLRAYQRDPMRFPELRHYIECVRAGRQHGITEGGK